jgi:hypothetical protein
MYTLGWVLLSNQCVSLESKLVICSFPLVPQHLLFQVGYNQRMHSLRGWYRIA